MIESGSGYLEMRTRFDSQHQRGYTLGLEFTLIRWDDNHSSIHPSRKAKRIVQVSSLCLVENKLEGKTFIHSFTPPSIHPSIHLEGQNTFQVPKGHRLGPLVLLVSKAPYVAVTSYTQLPQL